MARGITESDVFTACDALLLAGERPTIERVRQKIGRGSPNTVSPMLDAWFKGLGRRLQDPGAFVPAPGVPDPVVQAEQHFWEVAQAESRRDVDASVSAGLAEAHAQVDDAMRSVAAAESAAIAAAARVEMLEGEVIGARAALDAERLNHRGTTTLLESAKARCRSLEAQVAQSQQVAAEERARADQAIAAANERADGAERRAAMEIEGERMLRTRAEKTAQATAKRFETALREQIAATEQMNATEDRLTAFRVQANERESELRTLLTRHETRLSSLDGELVEVKLGRAHAESELQALQAAMAQFKPLLERRPARAARNPAQS